MKKEAIFQHHFTFSTSPTPYVPIVVSLGLFWGRIKYTVRCFVDSEAILKFIKQGAPIDTISVETCCAILLSCWVELTILRISPLMAFTHQMDRMTKRFSPKHLLMNTKWFKFCQNPHHQWQQPPPWWWKDLPQQQLPSSPPPLNNRKKLCRRRPDYTGYSLRQYHSQSHWLSATTTSSIFFQPTPTPYHTTMSPLPNVQKAIDEVGWISGGNVMYWENLK